ncbi:hypothetical protein HPB49_020821 [Dermacentor silvarum]|uniref:Uncharacterized protein n=1 Tax=Dermacentor silvarum TaxID=543639 RepID=A0ACB8DRB6_DERSI|nr:hypothetical protein HPB49_020821 [Dermacentor silvarum]
MSCARREALHQFSNHAVMGVNWRPTASRRRTNSSEGGSVCPIDQQSCVKDELQTIVLPAKIANDLKAHCWNENKGCEFVGALETLLQHYEEECTFHSFQCAVSGATILHRDLPAHSKAGCVASGAEASFANLNLTTAQDIVLSAEDIKDTVEKQKKQLDDLRERLARKQDRINNLGEMSAKQERKMQELERQQADSGRQPKGGFSRAVRNVVRRSFREVRRAVSSRQQTPRESESVEHLVGRVASEGKECSWQYESSLQNDAQVPQS